ncbi:hypothetical protein [Acidovorax sp. BLS4]|uniref:hypothetical protein n=1 Tax=Acidovorax sp. BLS4 TaxID=3273430 RepID=UPI002942FE7D|nr:hypothetical protein [Paracidovorax avenae]WOI44713.1 hypothetical protein R1Z03_19630 [Paracidovorax avenae]
MNASHTPLAETRPAGSDLAEQARPGHGIPSQDPAVAAQYALSPEEAERESKSSLMGGGVMAGTAAGAAVGAAVAGPVGVFVGGTAGAVAGALGGAAAGSLVEPDAPSADEQPTHDAGKTPNTVLPR